MGKIGQIETIEYGSNCSMVVISEGERYVYPRLGCEQCRSYMGLKKGDSVRFEANADNQISVFSKFNPDFAPPLVE